MTLSSKVKLRSRTRINVRRHDLHHESRFFKCVMKGRAEYNIVSGILLVGAGGHCRSCIEVIESRSDFHVCGIIGQKDEVGGSVFGYSVIGTDDDLGDLVKNYSRALVTIGQIKSSERRHQLFGRLRSLHFELPVVIAASAVVSKRSTIGPGTIVMHGATVNAGAIVGANCILNTHSLIEHDANVGDHCHISTGAIVNGGAKVENHCFVGSGAVVYQGIVVGEQSIVGAGALVFRNLIEHSKLRSER